MLSKTLTLKPLLTSYLGKKYYEQILVLDNDYPTALLHVDTFYTKEEHELYDLLIQGFQLSVQVDFTLIGNSVREIK